MLEPNQEPVPDNEPKEGRQVLGKQDYIWTRCIGCQELMPVSKLQLLMCQNFTCQMCRQNKSEESYRPAKRFIFDHHPEGQRIGSSRISREE